MLPYFLNTVQIYFCIQVARSTEWQYADNMVITDVHELTKLDQFIQDKVSH